MHSLPMLHLKTLAKAHINAANSTSSSTSANSLGFVLKLVCKKVNMQPSRKLMQTNRGNSKINPLS